MANGLTRSAERFMLLLWGVRTAVGAAELRGCLRGSLGQGGADGASSVEAGERMQRRQVLHADSWSWRAGRHATVCACSAWAGGRELELGWPFADTVYLDPEALLWVCSMRARHSAVAQPQVFPVC